MQHIRKDNLTDILLEAKNKFKKHISPTPVGHPFFSDNHLINKNN